MPRSLLRTRTVKLDADGHGVTEIYSAPPSEWESHKASLFARIPTGYSGRSAPRAISIDRQTKALSEGYDRIIAQYRTLTNFEYCDRHPSKAYVEVLTFQRGERIITDLDGKTVQGTDPTDSTGRTVWEIVEGSDIMRRPQTVYVVKGVVRPKSIYIDAFASSIGCINDGIMARLGMWGASREELLFFRMESQPRPYNKLKYAASYWFLWSGQRGLSWNKVTKARKMERKAIKVPYLDTDGVDTGYTKDVYLLVPTTTTRYARTYKTASFIHIDSMCNW